MEEIYDRFGVHVDDRHPYLKWAYTSACGRFLLIQGLSGLATLDLLAFAACHVGIDYIELSGATTFSAYENDLGIGNCEKITDAWHDYHMGPVRRLERDSAMRSKERTSLINSPFQ